MVSHQSASSPPPDDAVLSPDECEAAVREIVVFIDGHTKAGGILEFASELADEHGARLIGVFLQPEATITPAETFARGTAMVRISESHYSQLERIDADYRALFEDIVRRHGLRPDSEWRSLPYFSSEVGVHAYYADVVWSLNRGLTAGRIALLASRSPLSSLPAGRSSCIRQSARYPGSAAFSWDGMPHASPSGPWPTPCQRL